MRTRGVDRDFTRRLLKALAGIACAVLVTCGGAVAPVAAQACPGDCDGDGTVGISEIILAVSIVLGAAPLDQCPPLGPPPVGIDRVIGAVNSAQCACRPCPPPAATRTPTATPPPSATPSATATATLPALESTWREDNARLGSSTCLRDVNEAVRDALVAVACPLALTRRGDRVEVRDCDDFAYAGAIDGAGSFRGRITLSDRVESCTVRLDADIAANLGRSPTTATYDIAVTFSGSCGSARDCALRVTTRWTRLSGNTAADRAAGAHRGVAQGLRQGLRR